MQYFSAVPEPVPGTTLYTPILIKHEILKWILECEIKYNIHRSPHTFVQTIKTKDYTFNLKKIAFRQTDGEWLKCCTEGGWMLSFYACIREEVLTASIFANTMGPI